jgi:hypothetical protein
VIALQERLVVERVDLARPAVHEQEDHALGARGGSAAAWARAGRSLPPPRSRRAAR